MAINPFEGFNFGKEEEEEQEKVLNPFADYDFDTDVEFTEGAFADYNFDAGFGGGMTPFESSVERMKESTGAALGEHLPSLFPGLVPESWQKTGKEWQADAMKALEGYVPKTKADITQEEWADVIPNIAEKLQEQGAQNVTQLSGAVLGGRLASSPNPYIKGIGYTILGGTALSSAPPILNEVMSEHARILGKPTEQMTPEERVTGGWTALENWLLENINPARWAKFASKRPELPTDPSKLSEYLSIADKDNLIKQFSTYGKEVGKSAIIGGGQELTQTANIYRTSPLGVGGMEAGPAITETVVGAAGGGVYGSPTAISQARSTNKMIEQGKEYLRELNRQNLLKSGEQYYKEAMRGPAQEVTPIQYKVEDKPTSGFRDFMGGVADIGYRRSTDLFQDSLKNVKTGSQVASIFSPVFSMFGDIETGTGIKQQGVSFHKLKGQYFGKFSEKFMDIQRRWSKHIPFAGEMGAKVHPLIDAYVGAKLENKNVAEAAKALKDSNLLDSNAMVQLDNDIRSLRKEYDNIHETVSNTIGKDNLELGYTKDYLTRAIDIKAVKRNQQGFIDSIVNDVGIPLEQAQDIARDIINGKDPSTLTSEQIRNIKRRRGKGKESFEKKRSEKWSKLSDEFRNKSAFGSMQDYIAKASQRVASAETFGADNANRLSTLINKGIKEGIFNQQQAEDLWSMYDAEHNIYKKPRNRREQARQSAYKFLSSVTAVSLLGLAPISSITEPAWINNRVGFANMMKATPTVAKHVVRGMINTLYGGGIGKDQKQSFGKQVLNAMGLAINPQMNEAVDKLMAGDRNMFLSTFFRSPGGLFLTQYTNFVRVWTAVAGLEMMESQAKKLNTLKGRNLAALKRELRENGLSIEDFKTIHRLGKGKFDITNPEYLDTRFTKEDGTNVSVRDVLVPWLHKITADVALEPTVGNRPLWMSNPNLMLISQLKSFPVLFANTIMRRTARQLKGAPCTPQIAGGISAIGSAAAALALATIAMEIKDTIRNTQADRTAVDYVSAVGVPYLGASSFQQLASIPAFSVMDEWWRALSGDNPVGDTAEEAVELFMRATLGSIIGEQFDE